MSMKTTRCPECGCLATKFWQGGICLACYCRRHRQDAARWPTDATSEPSGTEDAADDATAGLEGK